jgi:hypothetical protein
MPAEDLTPAELRQRLAHVRWIGGRRRPRLCRRAIGVRPVPDVLLRAAFGDVSERWTHRGQYLLPGGGELRPAPLRHQRRAHCQHLARAGVLKSVPVAVAPVKQPAGDVAAGGVSVQPATLPVPSAAARTSSCLTPWRRADAGTARRQELNAGRANTSCSAPSSPGRGLPR